MTADRRTDSAQAKTQPSPRRPGSALNLIASRPDLAGLPVRGDGECRASDEAAKSLGMVSQLVRRGQARADRLDRSHADTASSDEAYLGERDRSLVAVLDRLGDGKDGLNDAYAPGLAQILCVESLPIRLHMTKMLAGSKGPKAGVALARQALFDLNPKVREAAITALRDRPREEYRQTLIDGFRHPWPAVAEHAAYALTAVDDRGAVPALSELLGLSDPAAPMLNEKKTWVVAEVVKVNHLRNCLLCHAPSTSADDPVRGFVPKPGEEIPVLYYAQAEGDFVRADLTYLRQDFSVMERVADPGKWPEMQRFDYMVRQRELTDQEIIDMADVPRPPSNSYPQRQALLLTLERLNRPGARDPRDNVGLGP